MLDKLKETARNFGDVYSELKRLKEVPCLVPDDLGKERTTQAGQDYLYQIVNYRYNYKLQTIVTTNAMSMEELKKPWNKGAIEAIVSRLMEMGEWVKLERTENYRLKK